MKASRYNLVIEKEGRKFVYNQLRSSLLEVDDSLAYALLAQVGDELERLETGVRNELFSNGMLCEDNLNEGLLILASSKKQRFANDAIRVTIMPTLDCNFHCWYCYENHKESKMSSESINRVVMFCKELISNGICKHFHLDWFGGEPLLFFNEVVYPISETLKIACQASNVTFRNSITTNGYLITPMMVKQMQKIDLKSFQITLDGGKKFHNKTRFSRIVVNSFDVIVSNIVELCRKVSEIEMIVRINYTPKNIESIEEIAEAFPTDVRSMIDIVPQLVWQFKDGRNVMEESLRKKMETFVRSGYRKAFVNLGCSLCYAENMNQYVVNYDLQVYKCTARDFSEKYSIGYIDANGSFVPKPYYYEYFMASSFENSKCLECHLLPSCLNTCIQKHLEGNVHKCDKQYIEEDVRNRVLLYLEQTEM